jgi:hypothetical protein
VCALNVVIQALEFEPVGPQNQWVDVMFLTVAEIVMTDVSSKWRKADAGID